MTSSSSTLSQCQKPEPSKPSSMATTGRPGMDTYRNSVCGVRGSRNRRQTWRFRTFNQLFPGKVSLEAQVFGRLGRGLGARRAGVTAENNCPRWCGKLPSIIFTLRTYNIRCLLAIRGRYVTELCEECYMTSVCVQTRERLDQRVMYKLVNKVADVLVLRLFCVNLRAGRN